MAEEIERKFLVAGDGWRQGVRKSVRYRQGYLSSDQSCSIRVRVSADSAYLNIKSATLGVQRMEFEYPIPLQDAQQLLDTLCEGPLVEKTRHYLEHRGHTWEVDVFEGANAGLVVAEIELDAEDEDFERPPWVGAEVSHDPRYYNVCLVRHPYSEWRDGTNGE